MGVAEIFESMEYGPAPEGAAPAAAWLEGHGRRFGCFIGGAFGAPGETFASVNPATGETLAEVTQGTEADLDAAVAAARAAQPGWAAAGGHARARVLYALARMVQKHSRLFAVLETMDVGKPIRESRDIDVPLAVRHFYHHAGFAQLMEAELPGRAPVGVCGQVIPWNFPLLMLAWKVAPALAMGNAVVLKPAEQTPLTALLFADLSREAGLPPGVLNVVTGDGRTGAALVTHPGVDKVAFTGSTAVGRRIREATAGTAKRLTLELGGKSPYIVFDDADLDSAVEGLVDAIWFNGGQVCCAGSRLLVQEGVAEEFHARLRRRMDGLRLGDPLDKAIDVGSMVSDEQKAAVEALLAAHPGGERHVAAGAVPGRGAFVAPMLIAGLEAAHPLMREEIFGPVLVSTTFRTPAEAVMLANDTRYGLAASVWSESVNLALDVAPKLAAGVVWINGTNMLDAAAPFGGVRESGFGREGGWEGLEAYTWPEAEAPALAPVAAMAAGTGGGAGLDRTHKLYVGGKQARPDGGQSRAVWGADGRLLGHAALANRKDVRNAVEAARGAAAWSRASGHARAQVLYYMAENLAAREAGFAALLTAMVGRDGAAEAARSVERLFHFAAWADKWDGGARGVPIRGVALAMREPVGAVGALCADEAPLLGLVTVIGAAMAAGSRVVAVASEPFPLAAAELIQVLETSDVPAGVVNLLTGSHAELAPTLAGHADLDAVWSFSSTDLSGEIERLSAADLKRTWVNNGRGRDWMATPGREWLEQASEVKTVWIPYGEG